MKIIVTGAIGHIGSYIIRDLGVFFPGSNIVMIDNMMTQRFPSLFNLPSHVNYRFIEGDINQMNLRSVFVDADVVIHLAAITDAAGSIDNEHLADDAVGVAELSATGTASSSTFLRGDNSWTAIATDANTTTKGLYEHAHTIAANYSITSGNNAMSVAPVTINSSISVTVPTGSTWTIV